MIVLFNYSIIGFLLCVSLCLCVFVVQNKSSKTGFEGLSLTSTYDRRLNVLTWKRWHLSRFIITASSKNFSNTHL